MLPLKERKAQIASLKIQSVLKLLKRYFFILN